VGVSGLADDHKTAQDNHKKDNEASDDVDVRKNSVEEGVGAAILFGGGRALEKELITKIETCCHK